MSFESARWTAAENLRYCTKEGRYEIFGEWPTSSNRPARLPREKIPVQRFLRNLLGDESQDHRNTWDYLRNKSAIDSRLYEIRELQVRSTRFIQLQYSVLRYWQNSIIKHLFHQPERKICWLYDSIGGKGKSFLSHLLYFVYQFELFDGITSARDITMLISERPRGFFLMLLVLILSTFHIILLKWLKMVSL